MDSYEPTLGSGNLELPTENVDNQEPTDNSIEKPVEAVETTVREEETSTQNETERSEKDGDSESPNPSKVINELGEDKKKLAQDLVSLSEESEHARELVKQRISEDPKMDTYLKKKFPEQYDNLFKDQVSQSNQDVDLEQIREEERAKIKADMLFEQVAQQKNSEIENFAVQKGFNSEELNQLKEYVSLLESKEDLDVAIQKAGLLVNQSKTLAKTPSSEPKSEVSPEPKIEAKTTYTNDFERFAQASGRDPQEYFDSIKKVEDRLDGNTFKLM